MMREGAAGARPGDGELAGMRHSLARLVAAHLLVGMAAALVLTGAASGQSPVALVALDRNGHFIEGGAEGNSLFWHVWTDVDARPDAGPIVGHGAIYGGLGRASYSVDPATIGYDPLTDRYHLSGRGGPCEVDVIVGPAQSSWEAGNGSVPGLGAYGIDLSPGEPPVVRTDPAPPARPDAVSTNTAVISTRRYQGTICGVAVDAQGIATDYVGTVAGPVPA